MRELGIELEITNTARLINERQPAETVNFIQKISKKLDNFASQPIITLMGIAFKGQPATDDLRGTMAKPILNELRKAFPHGFFRGFDPVVALPEISNFGLDPVSNIEEAFFRSSLIVILNNHPIFLNMPISELADSMMKPGLIYDYWNCFKSKDLPLPKGLHYVALGSHGHLKLS
jgi:UDP-N-acetyl-D-mannosaminuronic acid dehydrogenase